ncbi:MAG: hypothetical protein M1492_09110 [Gammaproteobacteria bacterium]|jgi:hypothetical protein|uniref:hypothetical protein n=1 Tax=Acidithiobacillus ferrooxidans TaxID=920 RepID=UPI001C07683D|nr:hypothetical protein [Acidithiobacillus ferrooxidans]MBU2774277.1 hypothetical protein [Acidithiobacillus ferrooxidans]MCL4526611.1 hypothetical protein [Gammaproteobacteria bacterium]
MRKIRRSLVILGAVSGLLALSVTEAFAGEVIVASTHSVNKTGSIAGHKKTDLILAAPWMMANVLIPLQPQDKKCTARLMMVTKTELYRFIHGKNHVVSVPLVDKYGEYLGSGKFTWGSAVTQGHCEYSAVLPAVPAYLKAVGLT